VGYSNSVHAWEGWHERISDQSGIKALKEQKSASERTQLHPGRARPHLSGAILNKEAIIEKIIAALESELEGYTRSARAAHADATDEQSKAENKYDTRGLESSYLARGQSRQALDVIQAIQQYRSLAVRQFSAQEPINIGAVVELERQGERLVYFVGQSAGGTEVDWEGQAVLVITPQSPMGHQLIGRKQGERLQIKVGGSSNTYRVAAVS
jgi:transcription elongation GreA/GreB family factor